MKNKETLEEARTRIYIELLEKGYNSFNTFDNGFDEGAKWVQERSYSEEEVNEIFKIAQMAKHYGDYKPYTFEEAMKQFKKK